MKIRIIFWTALVTLSLLCGCTTYQNPLTGKTEYTLYSEKDEVDMGKSVDAKLRKENRFVTNERVSSIGQRLVEVCERKSITYHFGVIDNKEINAFAVPGGYIYVYTGLLNKIESEDELAAVLAHEIAHIVNRDSVRMMQNQILYTIPTSILFGSGRYQAIQKAVDTLFTLGMLKYSRSEELRADTLGVVYAYRAGFDPEGMISFFRKLASKETSLLKTFEIFSSHPDFGERIKNVQAVIAELKTGARK
ncbi:MAG: M48 family metallopeptidase [Candidatus Omnitrophica bacterium]|nr:M48 family metallopeptidase [Candidatus Omnitrophota bacterium]MCM8769687.1 M48 family metallopeptidase [Candidatus Omnitrophota bacterium]